MQFCHRFGKCTNYQNLKIWKIICAFKWKKKGKIKFKQTTIIKLFPCIRFWDNVQIQSFLFMTFFILLESIFFSFDSPSPSIIANSSKGLTAAMIFITLVVKKDMRIWFTNNNSQGEPFENESNKKTMEHFET